MLLISHRGNLNGPNQEKENSISYIEEAISLGYDVEIDLWLVNGDFFLGHDSPQYKINLDWIISREDRLWVHCKNIKAIEYLNGLGKNRINYFWHQNDDVTLTSMGFIWTYPGKQLTKNSIAVMPEISEFDNIESCFGICSDVIQKFKYTSSVLED